MSQAGSLGGGVLPVSVATSYVCDAGTAVPAAYILNVKGAGSTSTAGAGNTITISSTGAGILTAQVTLHQADINNLATTPIQIVPAPGVGLALMFIGVSSYFWYQGSQAFAGAGSINLSYGTTGATARVADNAAITGTTSGYTINSSGFSQTGSSGYSIFPNAAYNITGGPFTGGAGNQIQIQVQYYIITAPAGPA